MFDAGTVAIAGACPTKVPANRNRSHLKRLSKQVSYLSENLKTVLGESKPMDRAAVKLRHLSGLLLIAGLSLTMITLVALSVIGVLPYPGGLLNILGTWLGIVFVILAAKTIFNRRYRS